MVNAINKSDIQNLKYQRISFKQNKETENRENHSIVMSKTTSNALRTLALAGILLGGAVNAQETNNIPETTSAEVQQTESSKIQETFKALEDLINKAPELKKIMTMKKLEEKAPVLKEKLTKHIKNQLDEVSEFINDKKISAKDKEKFLRDKTKAEMQKILIALKLKTPEEQEEIIKAVNNVTDKSIEVITDTKLSTDEKAKELLELSKNNGKTTNVATIFLITGIVIAGFIAGLKRYS